MQKNDKLCRLTLPLSPLLHPGEEEPRPSQRIRPADSLDLSRTVEQLRPSILTTVTINNNPWSVVSVFSPYSPHVHVMLMETGKNRYLPGPESLPPGEGEQTTDIMATIIDFIAAQQPRSTIYLGYNWSPRAWGIYEERGGFQSIPTKWHTMIWDWPDLQAAARLGAEIDWINRTSLSFNKRRIFGEAAYLEPFSRLIVSQLRRNSSLDQRLLEFSATPRGVEARLSLSLSQLISGTFFTSLLHPPLKPSTT